jgi:mercuric reductase
MNDTIHGAVDRLKRILPLQKSFSYLNTIEKRLYQGVLCHFIESGHAPQREELKAQYGEAETIVDKLARNALITLDESGEIYGAYPFTMEQRAHQVTINGVQVHAMCALDALAPSAMFSCHSIIHSQCGVSKQALCIEMEGKTVLNKVEAGDIHIGINWQAACGAKSCADSLCREMIFLHDREIAHDWSKENTAQREIFTLDEAIAFSAAFFSPLMAEA